MKRLKKITAGRLVRSVVYTVPSRSDTPQTRAKRHRISSDAQARLNVRTSKDKLEMLLACNFDVGDLWVTLTYDDEHLPADRDGARRCLQKFIRQLRTARRLADKTLLYVYCTQSILEDGSKRWHHHLFINAAGPEDFETIRSLWIYATNIKIDHVDSDAFLSDKAAYMCHEPIQHGKPKVGEQMWTPCRGLKRPEVETVDVPDDVTLQPPADAYIVDNDSSRTEWGDYAYIKYWLPRRQSDRPHFYPRGRY